MPPTGSRPRWTDTGEPRRDPDRRGGPEAASTAGYASLWRLLLSVDLVRSGQGTAGLSPDDPLATCSVDGRALHSTVGWTRCGLRLVDVDRALAARRYPTPIDLVIEVRDEFLPLETPAAGGGWRGIRPVGYCGRTDLDPDLVLGSGGTRRRLPRRHLAGDASHRHRVTEVSPGAVTLASAAFGWPVTPWCPDDF